MLCEGFYKGTLSFPPRYPPLVAASVTVTLQRRGGPIQGHFPLFQAPWPGEMQVRQAGSVWGQGEGVPHPKWVPKMLGAPTTSTCAPNSPATWLWVSSAIGAGCCRWLFEQKGIK